MSGLSRAVLVVSGIALAVLGATLGDVSLRQVLGSVLVVTGVAVVLSAIGVVELAMALWYRSNRR